MAFYVGNKGTWDEWRFFVKRITLIFCFRINRTIYPDLIRLSHLYFFILIFTLKGWSTKSQNFFTRWAFNHTTHTRTHSNIHMQYTLQSMILNNDAFEPANAFEVKKKTENVFALWWMGVWWVHHVQFIVYTIIISRLETRLENF